MLASANAKKRSVRYGATITAGLALYEDTSDLNDAKIADCTTSAATAAVAGIALNGGGDGQPGEMVTEDDDFTPGGTLVAGTVYVLSTAGKICPIADVLANDYITVLGVAKSTTKMIFKPMKSGVKL